jgi:hypothetical protein
MPGTLAVSRQSVCGKLEIAFHWTQGWRRVVDLPRLARFGNGARRPMLLFGNGA